MPPQPTPASDERPHEVSQDIAEVRIAEANAITLSDALQIAERNNLPLGKSTLQRWAKHWLDHPQAGVKVVLQVTRTGRHYELDRDDFENWLLEQARNQEAPQDLERPHEASQDLDGSRKTSQDPARPHETSAGERTSNSTTHDDAHQQLLEQLRTENAGLKDENLQLKIDLGARKQLLVQTAKEFERRDAQIEGLLRENGALQFQVRQLTAGDERFRISDGARADTDGQGSGGTSEPPTGDVDNPRAGEPVNL